MIVFIVASKVIGVLGGMGPEATAQFYNEMIKECQRQYKATLDSDYPEILIYNLPIPDVVNEINNQKKIILMLTNGLKKLERFGVDFIVVPCNTVNIFYDKMKSSIKIPLYSILVETAKKIKALKINKVGIIGTENTLKYKLYDLILKKYGIYFIKPNKKEEKVLTKIILNILKGKKLTKDKQKIIKIINNMQKAGAKGIILGCTELPLLINQKDAKIKLFDSLKILAESTIKYSIKKRHLKKKQF